VSDANEMLAAEQFVYADCYWQDGRFVPYRLEGGRLVIDEDAGLDTADRTDVFPCFATQVGDATCGGGETSAHGSCGFFFLRRGARLEWVVMSLESDPFVEVEAIPDGLVFRSRSGQRWIVGPDGPASLRVEASA